MKGFIFGTIFGILITTVGLSGMARMLDKGIETIKTQTVELSK